MKAALAVAFEKLLDESLRPVQNDRMPIVVSAERYSLMRERGWVDDEGNLTEKAEAEMSEYCEGLLREWHEVNKGT